jgi:5'-deoxynucleotidase
MAICRLCQKDRDLVDHSPFYGILANESDKKVRVCRICASKWEDNQTKPYTKLLENEIWSKEPQDGVEAVLTKLRRMNYMVRYGAEVTTNPESLAEHSFWVQMIAFQIAKTYNLEVDFARLAWLAMFHDVAEIMTGDVPTPLKNPGLKSEVDRLESIAEERMLGWGLGFDLSYDKGNLDDVESRIVKCADHVSSIIYSAEEALIGSHSMGLVCDRAMTKFRKYVKLDWERELYQKILIMIDSIE